MKIKLSSVVRLGLLLVVVVIGWATHVRADEGCKYCLRIGGSAASCQNSAMGTAAPALDICGTHSFYKCTAICMGNCCQGSFGEDEVDGEIPEY